jgi:hypothetical protein
MPFLTEPFKLAVSHRIDRLESREFHPQELLWKICGVGGYEVEAVPIIDLLNVFLSIHSLIKNNGKLGSGPGELLHGGVYLIHYAPENLGIMAIALIFTVK